MIHRYLPDCLRLCIKIIINSCLVPFTLFYTQNMYIFLIITCTHTLEVTLEAEQEGVCYINVEGEHHSILLRCLTTNYVNHYAN